MMTTPICAAPAWLDQLETQSARDFAAYWLSRRGGLFMPRRRDIDPSEIRNLLPWISLIEVLNPETAVVRLAGTAHRETLGFEPTGRNLVDLADPAHRPIRGWRFWAAATQPCGQSAIIQARFSSGISDEIELVLLPVRVDDPRERPLLFGVMASIGQRQWLNAKSAERIAAPDRFGFLDIGAGVPNRVLPENLREEAA
jgi:hypothetical protein